MATKFLYTVERKNRWLQLRPWDFYALVLYINKDWKIVEFQQSVTLYRKPQVCNHFYTKISSRLDEFTDGEVFMRLPSVLQKWRICNPKKREMLNWFTK